MPTPVVLETSADRFIITPAEIESDDVANGELTTFAERQARSLEVSGKLKGIWGGGRAGYRQTYSQQMTQIDGSQLRPTRYPIEEVPEIWLGGAPMARGSYRLAGECRYHLVRNDSIFRTWADTCWPSGTWRQCGSYSIPKYTAGYVPPDSILSSWTMGTAYVPDTSPAVTEGAIGSWVASSNPVGQLLFENTDAGTSDAADEPDWPLSMTEWAPNFAYSDRWVQPLISEFVFEPTTPGTSDAEEEPDWTLALEAGDTVIDGDNLIWTARVTMEILDGTTTWTGRNAKPFPTVIRLAALLLARSVAQLHQDGSCDTKETRAEIRGLLMGECG